MEEKDKFSQLVDDLSTGKLSLTLVQMAIRTYVRQNPKVPDHIKDILCGCGDSNPGIIYRMFNQIKQVIGAVELAYYRGENSRYDIELK